MQPKKFMFAFAPVAYATDGVTMRVDAERLADHEGEFGGGWGVHCGLDVEDSGFYFRGTIQMSDGVGYPLLARWHGPISRSSARWTVPIRR